MLATVFAVALLVAADVVDLDAARERLDAGDFESARSLLVAALERGPEDEREVRLLLADAWLAEGAPEEALAVLEPLPGDDPEVAYWLGIAFDAWARQMEFNRARRDDIGFAYGEARSYLEFAAEHAPPGDTRAAVDAGYLITYTLREPDAAIALADRALEHAPDDAPALLMRGCALVQRYATEAEGSPERAALYERAVADLERAHELAGDWPEPWVQLAWLHETEGHAFEAVEAASRVVELQPDANFATLYRLARDDAKSGESRAASTALLTMLDDDPEELRRWIEAEDDPGRAALELSWGGGYLFERRRYGDLRRILGFLIEFDPPSTDVYNNHAFMCRETGYYEDAYASYSRALEIDDSDPRLLNDTALILQFHLERELERAVELYVRALEITTAELERGDLEHDRRMYLLEARRDAASNLYRLETSGAISIEDVLSDEGEADAGPDAEDDAAPQPPEDDTEPEDASAAG